MARKAFDAVAARIAAGELGASALVMRSMRLRVQEFHLAWAAYDAQPPV